MEKGCHAKPDGSMDSRPFSIFEDNGEGVGDEVAVTSGIISEIRYQKNRNGGANMTASILDGSAVAKEIRAKAGRGSIAR
jgi:hypothetical protein